MTLYIYITYYLFILGMEQLSKNQLIARIKQKKELSGLANSLVSDALEDYLKKYSIPLKNLRHPQEKIIIKEIRAELRNLAGRFQISLKKRLFLLEKGDIQTLLKTHTSTAERFDFYPKLKSLIKSLKINSILDLGCGLNPLELASPRINYYASDINQFDLSLVKKFFEKHSLPGKIFLFDLRKTNALPTLPKADLCILFKVLDIIETKSHKLAKEIIEKLTCQYILISFATRTLSGKPMSCKNRKWLETILKILNYPYKIFSSNNEIFYLIRKDSLA